MRLDSTLFSLTVILLHILNSDFQSPRLIKVEEGFAPLPRPDENDDATATSDDFPLLLTSRKSKVFYHSSGRQIHSLRNTCPCPQVRLHPEAAAARGIQDRDWVFITTSQGKIRQQARLTTDIDTRVVLSEHGWWYPEKKNPDSLESCEANLNLLTQGERHFNREIGSSHLRGIPCQVALADSAKDN